MHAGEGGGPERVEARPVGPEGVELRRIGPEDAGHYRTLRLAALTEEPAAFARTAAEDAALPFDGWQQRATDGATGSRAAVFLALAAGRPVGMIVGFDDAAGGTRIVGMYVGGAHRGSGLVDRLVAAVAGWSRSAGRDELVLDVSAANARAIAAYTRLGFRPTGATSAHPLFAESHLIEMRRSLRR